MPLLVARNEWHHWLRSPIRNIVYPQIRDLFPAEKMTLEHTEDRWRGGKSPPMPESQLTLI